ncbi:MAG TPA: hypothetical protein VGG34_15845 [Opitutaceae bacterium]|jgi:hypothetical protein
MATTPAGRLKWQMFATSFTALFLEMMVIRWVPSVVHLIAFYANLMLLSSFLGLGAGAMLARRKGRPLFDFFPFLMALEIGVMLLCRNVVFGASTSTFYMADPGAITAHSLSLLAIFSANALLFAPLGQRMGFLFEALPRLPAYSWDLVGSLAGTLCFGAFSLMHFSPVLGLLGIAILYFFMSPGRRWLVDAAIFAAVLAVVQESSERGAIWSPYHYITVTRAETPKVLESAPAPGLLTMTDPPVYSVSVNQVYYHYDLSIDPARYSPGTPRARLVEGLSEYFRFPFALATGRGRALVLGAGGGGDVQGALASGFRHVDAVEIDPMVVRISRKFSAGAPYSDPRVSIHVDDARSFLANAKPGYDVVVFGLLDSHALFSSMNNVRLDGYVYTVEGVRRAYELLDDKGMLSLGFYIEKDWLLPKLYELVREATGQKPFMYILNKTVVFCVPKDPAFRAPAKLFQLQRVVLDAAPASVDVPTDDWPYLYLEYRSVPPDYLVAIGVLLAVSVLSLGILRGASFGLGDMHFGLIGMGFLMLETKSITDCSLYFGATWLVTTIVVAGVLLMVLAANLVAERVRAFSWWMYAPLLVALAGLFVVPREYVLGFDYAGRLAWALLVVPLPILFAGIIFSTTFRETSSPSAVFGANLVGAMVGGFCEYLGMAIGNHRLSLLVMSAYLGSMLLLAASRRLGRPI